ncbi:MAG: hypothetical protein ACAH11_03660 [Sphingomonas sp.]
MSDFDPASNGATIALDADHALVLFDLLARWIDEGETPPASFESPAEYGVLDALFGQLESQLAAPFRHDYAALLDAARARLG